MIHKLKLFLYYHSFRILFRKYRNQWFNDQLQQLIKDTLKEIPKGYWEKMWSDETTQT